METKKNRINHISFNQDNSCFAIATEKGFKVFESFPFNNQYERKMDGGIGRIEMLYRTNFVSLIGGGDLPKFHKKKVIIWDDYQSKSICELKFTPTIYNLKLKKDKIFVICEKNIFVFEIKSFKNIDSVDTKENQKGLFALNSNPSYTIIAFPGINDKEENKESNKGLIKIKNYEKDILFPIMAQEDSVSFIAMNSEGSLVATANEKGTIIKIHSCINGDFLQEFKRGKEKAEIHCICFDNMSNYMGVSSDRGTIHIWSMGTILKKIIDKEKDRNSKKNMKEILWTNEGNNDYDNENDNKINEDDNTGKDSKDLADKLPQNKTSVLKGLPIFSGYFQQEHSFAQIRINSSKSVCAFGPGNIVIVATYDGQYIQAQIDVKNGGDCKILVQESLMSDKKKE